MKNYKKVAALFLALVMTFGILFVYNTQGNSPNDFYIPVSIVPGSEIIPVRSFFIDDSLLNGETLYSVDNIEDWQYLKIELSALSRGFYAFQPIDVTLLNYHVQRARDLSLYYIGNPILPENLQLDSRISPNPIETPFGTIEWLNPFRMRTIGPTMHQAIFEFEGGPAYYENISNDLPIIGLRPENYGTINYHVIRAVEEMERLEKLVGTNSNIPSLFHSSGYLPYEFPTGFFPSAFAGRNTGFCTGHGMDTPMLDLIIHALANNPPGAQSNRQIMADGLLDQVERLLGQLTAFEPGNPDRVLEYFYEPLELRIPITLQNGRWLTEEDFYIIQSTNSLMQPMPTSLLVSHILDDILEIKYESEYDEVVEEKEYEHEKEYEYGEIAEGVEYEHEEIIEEIEYEIVSFSLPLQNLFDNRPYDFIEFIQNHADAESNGVTVDDFIIVDDTNAILYITATDPDSFLKFPLAIENTNLSQNVILMIEGVEVQNELTVVRPSPPTNNRPNPPQPPELEDEEEIVIQTRTEDREEEQISEYEEAAPERVLPPSHRIPRREVIVITPYGRVTKGGREFQFDPNEFGAPHINGLGVSVLPARMILSILLNSDPHDNSMFIWDYVDTRFAVDPNDNDIIFELYKPTMFVRNIPRPILSGENSTAFLTAPYIDIFQNNRMFVPTRTIAEVLEFSVHWDATTANVTLIPIE